MLGHVGDGNFHETILFNGAEERELVSKCVHDMVHRAIEMEGTCTVSLILLPRFRLAVCFPYADYHQGRARHWFRQERVYGEGGRGREFISHAWNQVIP